MSVRPIDSDAPKRVDPDYSLWVLANAGAGKTHVLIDRIVRLLISGTPPERILCLTFTKAAAAEMATRLAGRLGDYALMDDDALRAKLAEIHIARAPGALLARTRTLFARALETPGGLKIQTIHAFCERLLGRFPIEAGIAPHFEVLDDRVKGELLRAAQDEVVTALDGAGRAYLERLAGECDADGFFRLVQDLMRFVPLDDGDPRAALWSIFSLAPGSDEDAVRAMAVTQFDEAAMRGCRDALKAGAPSDVETAEILSAYLSARDRAVALEAYALAFLKRDGGPRARLATKKVTDKHRDIEMILRREQERMSDVMRALANVRSAELAYAALVLGRQVVARYEAQKRARAALDFDDLIARAVALVEKGDAAEWVLYKLDGGLDHILVDEAQDTNLDQWRVVAALAREFFSGSGAREAARTLFVVGDDKQSIYSFQGADPNAFAQMMDAFKARVEGANRPWSDHIMKMSWRSTAPVLTLVNAVFAGTLHEWRRVDDGGLVEVWPTEKPEDNPPPDPWNLPVDYRSPHSPRARLARRIAREIRGWIDGRVLLPSQGRPIRPGDVMILVRRRNSFVDEVIRELKLQNIPVAGSDRLALTAHIAVMDLMALMRFVLLPGDDLNLASLLKSPLFGFDDDRLFALVHGRAGSVFDALREAGDGAARAVHAQLVSHIVRAQSLTPFLFLSHVLGPMGGRAALVSRLGDDANDPIDELVHLALAYEQQHPPALQGFVQWLDKGEAEVKRDMEHGHDQVRVMTVHGAKGLEANIVILPDTCTLPHERSRAAFFPLRAPGGDIVPVWSPRKSDAPGPLEAARAARGVEEEAEHRRLLYVAMTRARDRLYVCGYQGARELSPSSWHALVGAAMAELDGVTRHPLAEGGEILRLETPQRVARMQKSSDVKEPRVELPPFAGVVPATELSPLRWFAPSALKGDDEIEEPAVRSPLSAAPNDRVRFARGRLIHRLLEVLPGLAPDVRAAAARRFLAQPVHGLDSAAQDDIASAAMRIMNEAAFSELFGPASRAEVPVVGFLMTKSGAVPVHGIVDRLAVIRDRVLIVDYKTNRPPPRRADAVPRIYVRQMAAYREILRGIYPHHEVVCALLWTEGPHLMALSPSSMDDALAGVTAS